MKCRQHALLVLQATPVQLLIHHLHPVHTGGTLRLQVKLPARNVQQDNTALRLTRLQLLVQLAIIP